MYHMAKEHRMLVCIVSFYAVGGVAQWLERRGLWLADFPWSMTRDDCVGKVSAMDQPTRPTQPFIPLGSVNE